MKNIIVTFFIYLLCSSYTQAGHYHNRSSAKEPKMTKIERVLKMAKNYNLQFCNATEEECESTAKFYRDNGCITTSQLAELMKQEAMPICVFSQDRFKLHSACFCPGIFVNDDPQYNVYSEIEADNHHLTEENHEDDDPLDW